MFIGRVPTKRSTACTPEVISAFERSRTVKAKIARPIKM
jgi:hypothetical protein